MLYLRILFLIAGLCSLQVQTAPVTPTDADRREIYQVVINATVREYADNSKQKIRQVVVSPKTCAEVKANASPEQADVDLHTLLGHMFGDPPMDDPLVVSFIEANRKPQSLPKDLKFSVRHVWSKPGSSKSSWNQFYDEYPDSAGSICVSAIGFDETASRALVYRAHSYGLLGGYADLIILSRDERGWRRTKSDVVWVS